MWMKLVLRLVVHLFCSSVNDRKESCKLNNLGPIELDILLVGCLSSKYKHMGLIVIIRAVVPCTNSLLIF